MARQMQAVTFGPTLAPTMMAFGPAFADLVSVSWTQGFSAHQFDNIVITSDVAPPPVPCKPVLLSLIIQLITNELGGASLLFE